MITDEQTPELDYVYNFTVKKVTSDIETLNFNTGISQMMIFVNEVYKLGKVNRDMAINFVKMLSTFAPHLGEEMYNIMTGEETVAYAAWPTYDESKLKLDTVEIVAQINGKVKAKIDVPGNMDKAAFEEHVMALPEVKELIEGKEIVKIIAVPGRLVNIVVK